MPTPGLLTDAPSPAKPPTPRLLDPGRASRTKPARRRACLTLDWSRRQTCLTPDAPRGQNRPPSGLPDPARTVTDKTARRLACLPPDASSRTKSPAARPACSRPRLADKLPTPGLLPSDAPRGQSRPRRRACRPRPRHNEQNHPLPFPARAVHGQNRPYCRTSFPARATRTKPPILPGPFPRPAPPRTEPRASAFAPLPAGKKHPGERLAFPRMFADQRSPYISTPANPVSSRSKNISRQ